MSGLLRKQARLKKGILMVALHPMLLHEGSATWIWPLSRQTAPKQFSPRKDKESLFQTTAKVTVDQDATLMSENQSVYIPLGTVHRMEYLDEVDVVPIKVQTGFYLGEDDAIRCENVYACN